MWASPSLPVSHDLCCTLSLSLNLPGSIKEPAKTRVIQVSEMYKHMDFNTLPYCYSLCLTLLDRRHMVSLLGSLMPFFMSPWASIAAVFGKYHWRRWKVSYMNHVTWMLLQSVSTRGSPGITPPRRSGAMARCAPYSLRWRWWECWTGKRSFVPSCPHAGVK